ncbi:deoxyribose-phosphate aldolase [Amaricoccus sp.]|uniref:deoxyribose-phosphate aldolase n=1 Tax=Amaricoccus sp. TaxID=1872485 RepID=UPI001B43EE45|nr:deoxyribose-phosphate aldolase [Amaricoccus sp.]MBP7241584.1 deoxyribose-phosphate aldolase [Amaricoccus sp.]
MSAALVNAARRALVCLDLTNLDGDCDETAAAALCQRAQTPEGSVAAVCIWPAFVAQARAALRHTGVRVATVINFPTGEGDLAVVKAEARAAMYDGADEIDMVIPWRAVVAGGEATFVAGLLHEVKDITGEVPLKAILETGELKDPALIGLAAEAAIAGGANFLKTSTGKTPVGATPEAARILLETIARLDRGVGFKASGGVRTVEQAAEYIALADAILGAGWARPKHFRIGASGLLDAILATLDTGMDAPEDDETY